jgi:ubiquinone/menaquinone biosynthesis C-methylase UbiE
VGSGVEYTVGSALQIPEQDGVFRIVTNVESSHCYGDMLRFLREVVRVLEPAGLLLFADTRDAFVGVHILERERFGSQDSKSLHVQTLLNEFAWLAALTSID